MKFLFSIENADAQSLQTKTALKASGQNLDTNAPLLWQGIKELVYLAIKIIRLKSESSHGRCCRRGCDFEVYHYLIFTREMTQELKTKETGCRVIYSPPMMGKSIYGLQLASNKLFSPGVYLFIYLFQCTRDAP